FPPDLTQNLWGYGFYARRGNRAKGAMIMADAAPMAMSAANMPALAAPPGEAAFAMKAMKKEGVAELASGGGMPAGEPVA
ncbi:MAG: hypothetical protein NT167_11045, partial [Verrucomicrobia bacterium]|nr:hypothetical protein [Verrucomicrobiota bacterium]